MYGQVEQANQYIQRPERNGRQRAARKPGGYQFPQLRVGREADYTESQDWDLYLNAVGNLNKRRGSAKNMGQVAVHYITDKEMRGMILTKHPDAAQDIAKAGDIYRGISKRLGSFIRYAQEATDRMHREGTLGEHPELMGRTTSADRHILSSQPHWQKAEVEVKSHDVGGVVALNSKKYGFILSGNNFLNDERSEVLRYLKREEGLDTTKLRSDWEPHATIYQLHSDLDTANIAMRFPSDATPEAMMLMQTRVIHEEAINA